MEWRDRSMTVTHFALIHKAIQLKPEFEERSYPADMMVMSHFMYQHDLVQCMVMHIAKCLPESVKQDAIASLKTSHPECADCTCSAEFIINMDQTNVYFQQAPKNSINMRGICMVHMH